MHDVDPHFYATAVREMIYHENDLTNHRIMWLLIPYDFSVVRLAIIVVLPILPLFLTMIPLSEIIDRVLKMAW